MSYTHSVDVGTNAGALTFSSLLSFVEWFSGVKSLLCFDFDFTYIYIALYLVQCSILVYAAVYCTTSYTIRKQRNIKSPSISWRSCKSAIACSACAGCFLPRVLHHLLQLQLQLHHPRITKWVKYSEPAAASLPDAPTAIPGRASFATAAAPSSCSTKQSAK